MIFKPELCEKVLSGKKTVTRRIVRDTDVYLPLAVQSGWTERPEGVWNRKASLPNGEVRYGLRFGVNTEQAVQPGRGKKSLGRIEILSIWKDLDVRLISPEECALEGLEGPEEFLHIWRCFYDPNTKPEDMSSRPASLYTAWRIQFRLVYP